MSFNGIQNHCGRYGFADAAQRSAQLQPAALDLFEKTVFVELQNGQGSALLIRAEQLGDALPNWSGALQYSALPTGIEKAFKEAILSRDQLCSLMNSLGGHSLKGYPLAVHRKEGQIL